MRALILAAVLVAGSGSSALSQVTRDVIGVAADDVLNVRAGPSTAEPIVGALSPLATGIPTGREGSGWTEVRTKRVQGWVASRFLGRAEATAPASTGGWLCQGTEPFWSATIQSGKVTFEGDDTKLTSPIADEKPSANVPTAWSFTFDGGAAHGTMEGGTVCSDGMSETIYRRTLHVDRAGRLFSGCCRRP